MKMHVSIDKCFQLMPSYKYLYTVACLSTGFMLTLCK